MQFHHREYVLLFLKLMFHKNCWIHEWSTAETGCPFITFCCSRDVDMDSVVVVLGNYRTLVMCNDVVVNIVDLVLHWLERRLTLSLLRHTHVMETTSSQLQADFAHLDWACHIRASIYTTGHSRISIITQGTWEIKYNYFSFCSEHLCCYSIN